MSETPPNPPVAQFHTPEELLVTARELAASGNPRYCRGAALEALAALEAFVQKTVFPALAGKFPESFCKFLEEKTKMDFDSRLSVLSPIATGMPVEKDAPLWSAYKQTRDLRKGVVHGSKKVTRDEAEKVIANTADWIDYLGRTIEFEKALIDLKQWVENQPAPVVRSALDAERVVAQFFSRSKAADVTLNKEIVVDGKRYEADAILKFGERRVVVETKFLRHENVLNRARANAILQVDRYRKISGIAQACIVIFVQMPIPVSSTPVEKHADGTILSVAINSGQP